MKSAFTNILLIMAAVILLSCSSGKDNYSVVSLSSLNGNIFPIVKDSVKTGGISLISSKIKQIRNQSAAVDIIGNSNFIYGTREAYLTSGRAVIELMNLLDFSCLIVGHREFYFGFGEMEKLSGLAKFPFVSANLVNRDSSRISFIEPYVVLKDGKSAVIGISTQKVIKANLEKDISTVTVLDPADAVKRYIDELKQKGIKNIIVAGDFNCSDNTGANLTRQEAERLFSISGADLFLTTDEEGKGCALEDKKPIRGCDINGREMVFFTTGGKGISNVTSYKIDSNNLQPDRTISEKMSEINNMVESVTGKILGTATDDIPHAKGDQYRTETPLGSLICDIMRDYTGTDIFLMNSGKVRKGFDKGPVTLGDLYDIMPYEGNIVSVKMTGGQILAVLEASCEFRMGKSFLQVSGLNFAFDSSKRPGSRVEAGSVKINGKPLDRERVYSVSLTEYIFQGGDSYKEFADAGTGLEKVHQKQMREIIREYIVSKETIGKVSNGRITDVSKQ